MTVSTSKILLLTLALPLVACGPAVHNPATSSSGSSEGIVSDDIASSGDNLQLVGRDLAQADTSVGSGTFADSNYNGDTSLWIGYYNSEQFDAYLSFHIRARTAKKAWLCVNASEGGDGGVPFRVWDDIDTSTMTWNDRSTNADKITTVEQPISAGQWRCWNITGWIDWSSSNTANFAISSQSDTPAVYNSSETTAPPQIIYQN